MKVHDFSLELSQDAPASFLMDGLRRLRADREQVRALIAKSGDWNPWPAPKFAVAVEA